MPDHPKVHALATALGIDPERAFAKFCKLVLRARLYAKDGSLAALEPSVIATWLNYPAVEGERVIAALRNAQFLEPDLSIHDWDEVQGAIVREAETDRVRKEHKRAADKAAAAPVGARTEIPTPPPESVTLAAISNVVHYLRMIRRATDGGPAFTPRHAAGCGQRLIKRIGGDAAIAELDKVRDALKRADRAAAWLYAWIDNEGWKGLWTVPTTRPKERAAPPGPLSGLVHDAIGKVGT